MLQRLWVWGGQRPTFECSPLDPPLIWLHLVGQNMIGWCFSQHTQNEHTSEGRIQDIWKGGGGVQIRSTSKKGGPDGGPILGPMLKSLHRGTKGGSRPPPPWIRPCFYSHTTGYVLQNLMSWDLGHDVNFLGLLHNIDLYPQYQESTHGQL